MCYLSINGEFNQKLLKNCTKYIKNANNKCTRKFKIFSAKFVYNLTPLYNGNFMFLFYQPLGTSNYFP